MPTYKLAAREGDTIRPSTVVRVANGARIGGEAITLIAGPCSVEGRGMLLESARAVRAAGAVLLRGGAFKPRTSPYSFQGLGELALPMLAEARRETGLGIVTEVLDPRHVELVDGVADVLQIGARNMQNFALLAEVGRGRKPVLIKRGMSSTVDELLHASEYVMAQGNEQVILCERGIRTFETATRSTLDVSAIPVLKRETHLPVIVDPSHAAGRADLVTPLACASIAAGADGIIVEVHPDPGSALSDGEQSLSPDQFRELVVQVRRFAYAAGRTLPEPAPLEYGPARSLRLAGAV
ncbi:MAG: 3-deoxy-7-phosphoheptulonate synthase [Gemmatimonadota bacterium]|nr:3-deoxy-7-phosphoheptulonate synthase [Gemmatimonadota bacterium]